MSAELAMNAYVLLGNVLHCVANRSPVDPESRFDSAAVRNLHSRIEPLPPARILEAVAALTPEERSTLANVCRFVILETTSQETETILALPSEFIDQTLSDLDL
jgi:hypothetical protein